MTVQSQSKQGEYGTRPIEREEAIQALRAAGYMACNLTAEQVVDVILGPANVREGRA